MVVASVRGASARYSVARPTPASLAAALMRVIDRLPDEQWRSNAAATSKRLAGQWSIDSQADEMLRLYGLVAAGSRVTGTSR